jgi:hypothetical protein
VEFREALERLAFRGSDDRGIGAAGAELFTATPNRYMTYTVHAFPDGTAIFSWEFAIADYLATKGIQIGSDEALNQFMYPRTEIRGQQDGAWLVGAVEQTEAMLADLRFDHLDR